MQKAAQTACRLSLSKGVANGVVAAFQGTARSDVPHMLYRSCVGQRSFSEIPHQELNPRPTQRVLDLVEGVQHLTVMELVWFNKLLQERLGVSDAELGIGMPMQTAAPPQASTAAAAAPAAPAEEEKTSFKVELQGFEASAKIKVIKEVRAVLPDLGLKEAKEAVEKLPFTLGEGLSKDDAAELEKKLSAVGAKVAVV